jgi:hypothetical protein
MGWPAGAFVCWMHLVARSAVGAIAIAAAPLFARDAVAQTLVTFGAPHAARAPTATLDAAYARDIDAQATAAKLVTTDDLVAFALRTTSRALRFGLRHQTRLWFDGAEREGNCVELAELFATILRRERGTIDARAWVVRSGATVLGETMSDPAWKDHDWVLVVARTSEGPRRLYVDPTLYAVGMGWDISRAVRGEVRLP